MERTGPQIFETEIFDKIDLSLKVTKVIEAGATNVKFEVCDNKWLRKGIYFYDEYNNTWQIGGIDPITGYFNSTPPAEGATLVKNQNLTIQKPSLLIGTPMSVNEEESKRIAATVRKQRPLIWLKETITGTRLERNGAKYKQFDFIFYALDQIENPDWVWSDRHNNAVFPMSQLAAAVVDVVDKRGPVELVGSSSFKEFNIYGRENQIGIVDLILEAMLGGLEYRITVQVSKEKCC